MSVARTNDTRVGRPFQQKGDERGDDDDGVDDNQRESGQRGFFDAIDFIDDRLLDEVTS